MTICTRCRKEIATGQEVVEKGLLRKKSYHRECMPIEKDDRSIAATCVNPDDDAKHLPHF
jgi:hypothetical protein